MSIWVSQLLCERRHCLHAQPWDDANTTRMQAATLMIDTLTGLGFATKRCASCGSTSIHMEHARTAFTSVREAAARMAGQPALTAGTGDLLEQSGARADLIYDSRDLVG